MRPASHVNGGAFATAESCNSESGAKMDKNVVTCLAFLHAVTREMTKVRIGCMGRLRVEPPVEYCTGATWHVQAEHVALAADSDGKSIGNYCVARVDPKTVNRPHEMQSRRTEQWKIQDSTIQTFF